MIEYYPYISISAPTIAYNLAQHNYVEAKQEPQIEPSDHEEKNWNPIPPTSSLQESQGYHDWLYQNP